MTEGHATDASVDGPVYVILPVHNRRATTERFLDHLLAQSDPTWRLLVLDDGSTDGTAEMVRARVPGAVVLRGSGDWWWAGALQEGYRWLADHRPPGDALVLLINDDTAFGPGFITAAREALRGNPRTLLLAELHDRTTGELVEVGAHVDWAWLKIRGTKDPASVNCFSTRGLFLRAGDFLEIGGFRPRWLPHYLSDYEFTIRATRKGFTLLSDPTVAITFDPSTTGSRIAPATSPTAYLRTTFSRKSAMNPVYWTVFVLLTSPARYWPRSLARIWAKFGGHLVRSFR